MKELETNLSGKDLRIGIVLSRFNQDVGDGLLSACQAELDADEKRLTILT